MTMFLNEMVSDSKFDQLIGTEAEINEYLNLIFHNCKHCWVKYDEEPYQVIYSCVKCNTLTTRPYDDSNYYDFFTPEGFFKLWNWIKDQRAFGDYKLFGKYIHEDLLDFKTFPRNIACLFLLEDSCKNCLEGVEKRCGKKSS